MRGAVGADSVNWALTSRDLIQLSLSFLLSTKFATHNRFFNLPFAWWILGNFQSITRSGCLISWVMLFWCSLLWPQFLRAQLRNITDLTIHARPPRMKYRWNICPRVNENCAILQKWASVFSVPLLISHYCTENNYFSSSAFEQGFSATIKRD